MKDRYQSAAYVAETIRAFLNGSGGDRDWDDFTSCPLQDPRLDGIRRRSLAVELPVDDEGRAELEALLNEAEGVQRAKLYANEGRRESISSRTYLVTALLVFVASVTGSDLFARTTIAGEAFTLAMTEHLRWASMTIVGLLFLFAPFAVTALICSSLNKRARTRSAVLVFSVALATLVYFYFGGFQAAQRAVLERKWTAAALSVGLLPFFIGIPLVTAVGVAALIVARVDRRSARYVEQAKHVS